MDRIGSTSREQRWSWVGAPSTCLTAGSGDGQKRQRIDERKQQRSVSSRPCSVWDAAASPRYLACRPRKRAMLLLSATPHGISAQIDWKKRHVFSCPRAKGPFFFCQQVNDDSMRRSFCRGVNSDFPHYIASRPLVCQKQNPSPSLPLPLSSFLFLLDAPGSKPKKNVMRLSSPSLSQSRHLRQSV